ncbi:MAG: ABC transporter ATP-binding protein [Eubacterium sp.]|nr:ABC transporter ATP-binding protein [Eubacterium sp.]
MSNLIKIYGLNKSYGKKEIFKDFYLKIESGRIVGLLGPNGSGKTTLIKILAGILSYSGGEVEIDDKKVGSKTKDIVAYLPDRMYFNENQNVGEIIKIFKSFYKDFDAARAEEMLKSLEIDSNMQIKNMSKGTKEKVQLIMVMSRRAKLYLLDEPIAGVDPAARDYIIRTIISNYEKDASVLISTHLIQDVENILDDVIFIKEGQVISNKPADKLREERNMSIDEIFREEFRC